jgi:ubiquinone/menaquinone biosynthesis C-methylase UbiE
MIEAKAPTPVVRRVYDLWSRWYGWVIEPLERRYRRLALARAAIRPHDRVLEVAVGAGSALLEILERVDRSEAVYGVDLSPRMLATAKRRAQRAGYTNLCLLEAEARALPFPADAFDLLFSSYMLDLIGLDEMPVVLGEFRRVLRPGGRLVLVSMSKERGEQGTLWERIYRRLPARWGPYVTGGCRPVLLEQPVRRAGFSEVRREFVRGTLSSEIVTAMKPARRAET